MSSTVSAVAAQDEITKILTHWTKLTDIVGSRVSNWTPPNVPAHELYPYARYQFATIEPSPDKWGVDSLKIGMRVDFFSKYEGDKECLQFADAMAAFNTLSGIPVTSQAGATIDCVQFEGVVLANGSDGVTRLATASVSFYLTPPH